MARLIAWMSDNTDLKLSHLDELGSARMVDVSHKGETLRAAVAGGAIRFSAPVTALLQEGKSAKGDILTVAKVAGVMAAKRTSELIPLCHPLPLNLVDIRFEISADENVLWAKAEARTTGKTGVEMEALTAVSVALLTVYDMCKSADRGMTIEAIRLLHKEGGQSGTYTAE